MEYAHDGSRLPMEPSKAELWRTRVAIKLAEFALRHTEIHRPMHALKQKC
jgi:hypothetical protein